MPKKQSIFNYGEDRLTVPDALAIARGEKKGSLSYSAREYVEKSRAVVAAIVDKGETVYGINTGFGPLCATKISGEDTAKLQYNLLRSHSVGVGEPVPDEIARLMLILKVHTLALGKSGVAAATLDRMLWFIENGITPLVPQQGSVGASGDLAPLAHLFLPLIGLGRVKYKSKIMETGPVLKMHGLDPLTLGPKEGLALINGTQLMTAYAVRALERLYNCLDTADIIGAMSLEALLGSVKPFLPQLHSLRPFPGCRYVAHRMHHLLLGSEMVQSHTECERVQDPYSLRCIPQVHGASRQAWLHLKNAIDIELNSVTDNPIVFEDGNALSGGNFHGQPIALPMDYATLAASELGNISDRRTFLLLEGGYEGLPKLLMKEIGINSGFMIPQYTSAALVSENKSLCYPASADSIPTSLGQEDHVSMGPIAARKLNRVVENLENILAAELLCAAQAFDYRHPLKSSTILEKCHDLIREKIDHAEEDRIFSNDLAVVWELIRSKKIVATANDAAQRGDIDLFGEFGELFGL